MKELVAIFNDLGFEKVKSYIQSGNVIFCSNGHSNQVAHDISLAIEKSRGFSPHVLILSKEKLKEAVSSNRFDKRIGKNLHLFFLDSNPVKPDLANLAKTASSTEQFELIGSVFYLYAPDGIGRSKLAVKIEKSLGVLATARNWNTISKLISMCETI